MEDDHTLLRRYAETRSEEAFAALVHRYLDLVYSAALRRLDGDAHRAADVAQAVFVALARDARRLLRHHVLTGWLYTATRNAAFNLLRAERRRRAHEREAAMTREMLEEPTAALEWERLRPVIDEALDALPESDHVAVLLRFFEQRSYASVGAALGVSEDGARMRTERALAKLRAQLTARGVTEASGRPRIQNLVLHGPPPTGAGRRDRGANGAPRYFAAITTSHGASAWMKNTAGSLPSTLAMCGARSASMKYEPGPSR